MSLALALWMTVASANGATAPTPTQRDAPVRAPRHPVAVEAFAAAVPADAAAPSADPAAPGVQSARPAVVPPDASRSPPAEVAVAPSTGFAAREAQTLRAAAVPSDARPPPADHAAAPSTGLAAQEAQTARSAAPATDAAPATETGTPSPGAPAADAAPATDRSPAAASETDAAPSTEARPTASTTAANPGPSTPADASAPTPPAASLLGPFRIGPPGHFVELGFALQLRFNLHGATGTPVTGDVELRRLRLFLRGHLLDDRLTFVLQLSTTPASLELIDAWADWRFTDALRVRVGQFKTPFTRHRQQSFATLALADWSVFATHFGAERQLGVMLHDGGGDRAHWVYQAGVFTGVNARASFARGLAALYAESVTNLSDLRTFHPPTEVHPAFIGRFGYERAGVHSLTSSDEAGGGLRHAVYLSAAWDVRPSYPVDFPLRVAPELLLKWNHVFLDVVAATGFFVDGAGAWGLASVGENVEVGWRFSPRWEVAGRYSRVDALDAARSDAVARAAAIVAAAPPDDAAAVAARYEKAGTPRWTQEVGAALNVYLVGDGLKWQTDVTWVRTDGPPRDEVRLRTQLQLAF